MPAAGECPEGRAANDKWLETQLETAYLFNPHLNNFAIDIDVNEGDVMLSGAVRSDIDRDLAPLPRALAGARRKVVERDVDGRDFLLERGRTRFVAQRDLPALDPCMPDDERERTGGRRLLRLLARAGARRSAAANPPGAGAGQFWAGCAPIPTNYRSLGMPLCF